MLIGGEIRYPESKLMGLGSQRIVQLRRKFAEPFKFCSLPQVNGGCPSINGLSFEKLEDTKVAKLEKPFSKEGVFGALSSFSGDKALGLNGFSMTNWQFSCEFVKRKVMNLFKDFHDSSRFV